MRKSSRTEIVGGFRLWIIVTAYLVGHGLEEDGGGGDLGLVGEEAVGEVATVRQVQPHNPTRRAHQRREHRKVGLEWSMKTNLKHETEPQAK